MLNTPEIKILSLNMNVSVLELVHIEKLLFLFIHA